MVSFSKFTSREARQIFIDTYRISHYMKLPISERRQHTYYNCPLMPIWFAKKLNKIAPSFPVFTEIVDDPNLVVPVGEDEEMENDEDFIRLASETCNIDLPS